MPLHPDNRLWCEQLRPIQFYFDCITVQITWVITCDLTFYVNRGLISLKLGTVQFLYTLQNINIYQKSVFNKCFRSYFICYASP